MIPEFVKKHYAFTKGCSYQHSIEMHAKLELYFNEIRDKGIATPTQEVDEVWHNFILHTKLYNEYCLNNYGEYIHHNPKLPENIDVLLTTATPKCDNQCNGGNKCDNQCNGGNKCDNQCNGDSNCDSDTFQPVITQKQVK